MEAEFYFWPWVETYFNLSLKLNYHLLLFLPLRVNLVGHVNHLAKRAPLRKAEAMLRRWED